MPRNDVVSAADEKSVWVGWTAVDISKSDPEQVRTSARDDSRYRQFAINSPNDWPVNAASQCVYRSYLELSFDAANLIGAQM